jgi:hypothetical protein
MRRPHTSPGLRVGCRTRVTSDGSASLTGRRTSGQLPMATSQDDHALGQTLHQVAGDNGSPRAGTACGWTHYTHRHHLAYSRDRVPDTPSRCPSSIRRDVYATRRNKGAVVLSDSHGPRGETIHFDSRAGMSGPRPRIDRKLHGEGRDRVVDWP